MYTIVAVAECDRCNYRKSDIEVSKGLHPIAMVSIHNKIREAGWLVTMEPLGVKLTCKTCIAREEIDKPKETKR